MKQYKCVRIKWSMKSTEDMLNVLAQEGWKFVSTYFDGTRFLLEKEIK